MTKTKFSPTSDQRDALRFCSITYRADWKARLMSAWLSGGYDRELADVHRRHYPLLQQVRNQGGPQWLASFDPSAPSPEVAKRIAGERKVLRHLLRRAKAMGMPCVKVNDGEVTYKATGERQVLDVVDSVDESYLYFASPTGAGRYVAFIVLGNSPSEVVCDCSSPEPDDHPFNLLMAEVMAYGEKVEGL